MGAVYLVQQLSTGRRRALKLMHPDLAQNEEARRRFVLEAQVGSRIPSEHIVEVHAAGVDEATGAPYLVMEFLEGEDLATRLRRRGPMDVSVARELFRQMCHALGAAHDVGIVHRDLKPQNVFLAEHQRVDGAELDVKVLDFGIAKLTAAIEPSSAVPSGWAAHATRTNTVAGGMIGTPLWMAPEQTESVPVAPSADVWALGLILYRVLTGRSFWRSGESVDGTRATVAEILREVLFEPLLRPTARAREQGVGDLFPSALEPVFSACVARDPASRFPDATSFWLALDATLQGQTPFGAPPRLRTGAAPAPLTHDRTEPDLLRQEAATTAGPELSLELAFEPRRAELPSPSLPTRPSRPTRPIGSTRSPPPEASLLASPLRPTEPPVLDEAASRWWLLAPAVFLVAGGVLVQRLASGGTYTASCRLCTLETGTFANGPYPLSEIRHDVEVALPQLDVTCLTNATAAGRVKLKFVIDQDGFVKGRQFFTASATDATGQCLVGAFRRVQFAQRVSFGPTDVTYSLEFDPARER
jgi:serine/threonine protein kinase